MKENINLKRNIFIGGAWPYANNSLHIGHIAGLISGDVLARYHRQVGDNVIYVSGTDCHGTPITVRAKKENSTPKEIAEKYHKEFKKCFEKMDFSYDLYNNTEDEYHKEMVQELLNKIYSNGYIYEKKEYQPYCEKCKKFLSDRELQLECPECGKHTKGDMCDCGYEPKNIDFKNATCIECGQKCTKKENTNLYISLSKLQPIIQEYVSNNKEYWRVSSINETEKYLRQGLLDKVISRDLDWGIDIPIKGYEHKKIYVWIEAVLGYITSCKKICENRGVDWKNYLKKSQNTQNNIMYMAHGKDNITFHTIIFPALLLAIDDNYILPNKMVATQYLNINSEKISKSKGNGITISQMLEQYDSDMIRYYLIANGPEKKDSNFSLVDFTSVCNAEVVNKYGNLVNRTLKYKGLEEIPQGNMNLKIRKSIEKAYEDISNYYENLEFKKVILVIKELIEEGNKYYEEQQPWKQQNINIKDFEDTIYTCCNLIANVSKMLKPIMPKSSKKIQNILKITDLLEYEEVEVKQKLINIKPLFDRIK